MDTAGDGAAAAISKGKEQLDKANQKKDEALSSQQMVDILDVCYDKALQGIPKVSKSVDELAEDYSSKYPTAEKAAKALVANQLVKCTTSGFLTGLGGIITLPVAVPANVSSVLYVQLRMIAAVAKLGGYEPNTDQVQTLVYACMTGQAVADVLKGTGVKLGTKIATASIEKNFRRNIDSNQSKSRISIDYEVRSNWNHQSRKNGTVGWRCNWWWI